MARLRASRSLRWRTSYGTLFQAESRVFVFFPFFEKTLLTGNEKSANLSEIVRISIMLLSDYIRNLKLIETVLSANEWMGLFLFEEKRNSSHCRFQFEEFEN